MAPDDSSARSWLPQLIADDAALAGAFAIESLLGVGGSGLVVRARRRANGECVAIKFLLSGSRDRDTLARFRREARIAQRMRSDHVARIFDVSATASGFPYLVIEYLQGVDLERLLLQCPQGQLPVPDAVDFVLQAAEGLAESHALGIVHRDLKPANLFCVELAESTCVKLLDF